MILSLVFPPVLAVASVPMSQATPPTRMHASRNYKFAEAEARLHKRYPVYIGFEVYDGVLYLAVNSTNRVLQLQVLRAVQQGHAPFLSVLRAQPGQVRLLAGRPDRPALAAASRVARRVRGLTSVQSETRIGRVVVRLRFPSQHDEARAVFRAAGTSPDAFVIVTPAPHKLPTGPALDAPHRAALQVPPTIGAGQNLAVTLTLRNTGTAPLEFEHGACDLFVEIRKAGSQDIVLPIDSDRTCPDIGYRTSVPPGEARELARFSWKVETTDWKPLPPGAYEVHAVFGPIERLALTMSRTQYVRATRYLKPAAARFNVVGGAR